MTDEIPTREKKAMVLDDDVDVRRKFIFYGNGKFECPEIGWHNYRRLSPKESLRNIEYRLNYKQASIR